MRSTEHVFGNDDGAEPDSALLETDFVQDGEKVRIIARTDFSFDGRIAARENGVLAYGLDATEWASGLLMVLIHARSDWVSAEGTTASWQVEVHNVSLDPAAPDLEIVERTIATSAALTSATAIPSCETVQFAEPFGPQLRVRWLFNQGLVAAIAALSLSASIYVVGRRGR